MQRTRFNTGIEDVAYAIKDWVGTPLSIFIHTIIFLSFFLLMPLFGVDRILSVMTNFLSIEAIYLALFIQITVNRQGRHIKAVKKDVADLQEDVEDILEDTSELTEDEDMPKKLT